MAAYGRYGRHLLTALMLVFIACAAPALAQGTRDSGGSLFQRQPPPAQGFSLRRLFGLEEPPPQQQPRAPAITRPRPKPPAIRQERVKPQATNRVVVFGDWLGDALAQGLDENFADMRNVAIARRTRGDLGLVITTKADWPKIAGDYLNSNQKVTVAVLMLGMVDRTGFTNGTEKEEVLSERWKQLYAERVDTLLRVFGDRGIPVVWVGLPPVRDDGASEQYAAINAIIRERVLQANGSYVDIWPGFVDDDNHYIVSGPDANGEETRLRLNDGLRFTRKGGEKIAHYPAVDIRRLLDTTINPTEVPTALPGAGSGPFIEIDKTVVPRTDASAPDIGVAQPLTRTDISPGGVLLKGRTNLEGIAPTRRVLREGAPATPVPGRMDDYYTKPR